MEPIELIGFSAGLLVAISSFPQLIKSWRTKSTKDIALSWLLINICGQVLWITYGIFKDSVSLIVMSSITLLMVRLGLAKNDDFVAYISGLHTKLRVMELHTESLTDAFQYNHRK